MADKRLYLNLVWHMHQPYYRDNETERFEMPWVFLHGIKDYYDIPWYQSRHKRIKATYNLVPSLLVQLQPYGKSTVNDRFLQAIKKPVNELEKSERVYLFEMLFFAQHENMIEPIPRYAQLFRKVSSSKNDGEKAWLLSDEEFLDLEVCFLLAWCGQKLRRESDLVGGLLAKKRFSQQEKEALLQKLADFVGEIIPYYQQLEKSENFEISTTPFYHPIMPLLCDMKNTQKADESVIPPENVPTMKHYAIKHLHKGMQYYEELFGHPPAGIWPSEGSIDDESLKLYADAGVVWACSDEEVLYRSLGGAAKKHAAYRPYRFGSDNNGITLFFRDKRLSDAIGFEYARMDATAAVDDFMKRLKKLLADADASVCLTVILDGENAWEYYPDNASEFFDVLYTRLEASDWITTQTLSEASSNEAVKSAEIKRVVPGSWINANFAIWAGQKEKNRAWELIAMTLRAYESKDTLGDQERDEIENELMISQGSDWYWWFGDTHYTAQKGEFDYLFRRHLIHAYHLMGETVPDMLLSPIITTEDSSVHTLPKNPISIRSDGENSSFFEWMGAGEFNLEKMGSAMDSSTPYAKRFLYGFDGKYFSFALSGVFAKLDEEVHATVYLDGEVLANVPLKTGVSDALCVGRGDRFLEFTLPESTIRSEQFECKIRLHRDGELLQDIPFHGTLKLHKQSSYPHHWFI